VHLGLFVHRVRDLDPGLYCLVRSADSLGDLRAAMKDEYTWDRPPECPDDLPLYALKIGDARRAAAQLSCGQDIAGDGAFSFGMLADFRGSIERGGAWMYRRLHWETGLIGQVMYLEAEASGIRSTGIGCFFDDPVHGTFGLEGDRYQTLYHFTVGGPVEDTRLTTLPGYPAERVSVPSPSGRRASDGHGEGEG